MTTRRHAIPTLALFGLGIAACSSITSTPPFDQTKRDKLQIQVTTDPPPDGSGNIFRDAVIHLGFDDYPDPDSIGFGPILLRSGTSSYDVELKVDLVGKQVLVTPHSLLQPNTQYELVVSDQVRALSGRSVASAMVAPLSVGAEVNPSPSPSPSPAPVWADVSPYIGGTCASYCHTPDRCIGRSGKRNPTIDLDLTKPGDPTVGLIGVPSLLVSGTDHPLERVVPGDSSRSMLMRKLLGGDPHTGLAKFPAPDKCMIPPETAPDNLGVPGRRMPLHESPCGDCQVPSYLAPETLRLVQSWIDGGAKLE